MRKTLVVFDWDGTLVDSHHRIIGCLMEAQVELALDPMPPEQLQHVIGLSLPHAIAALYPEASHAFIDRFVEVYRDRWFASEDVLTAFFDGARACLHGLRDRGLLLAVATGKGRSGLDRELHELDANALFIATRCADETRSKPHPQMLLELLEVTKTSPEHAMVIGDTTFDLEMARAARVDRIGVTYGSHSRDALRALEPLTILDHISGLLPWLDAYQSASP